MIFIRTSRTTLFGILTIACSGFFMGEVYWPATSLSLDYVEAEQLEEQVSPRNKELLEGEQSQVEKEIEGQINQVMSKYKTGLEPELKVKIPQLIINESKKYGYDPLFLTALIITQSSFNNLAHSQEGGLGLMQIHPKTAATLAAETQLEWEGKATLYDPSANIALGAYYLNKLINRFGQITLALDAYFYGPTKLAKNLKEGTPAKDFSGEVINQYEMIRSQDN